jgi:hypothetical protein
VRIGKWDSRKEIMSSDNGERIFRRENVMQDDGQVNAPWKYKSYVTFLASLTGYSIYPSSSFIA